MNALRRSMLLVSGYFILLSLVATLATMFCGGVATPFDAFFDGVSAATATGATSMDDAESLSSGYLVFRSAVEWLSSLSILLIAMVFFPNLGIAGSNIGNSESSVARFDIRKIKPKARSIARFVLLFYGLSTLAAFVILLLLGLSGTDAAVYAFSSISTGGFGTGYVLKGAVRKAPVLIVLIVLMLIGSMDFTLIRSFFRHRGMNMIKDSEHKLLFPTALFSALAIFIALKTPIASEAGLKEGGTGFLEALFQSVSFLSTTGYSLGTYTAWPTFCRLILMGLCFAGGSAVSCAGGIKQLRLLTSVKYVARNLNYRLHPNQVFQTKLSNKALSADTISGIVNFALLYIAVLVSGALLLAAFGSSLDEAVSASLACLSNTGAYMSTENAGLFYGSFSFPQKLVLMLEMLAGRLELFSFLSIFTPMFWREDG